MLIISQRLILTPNGDFIMTAREKRVEAIKKLALEEFNESIREECKDEFSNEEKIAQGMGFLLASLHHFSTEMFLSFAYACEDANFHSESEYMLKQI